MKINRNILALVLFILGFIFIYADFSALQEKFKNDVGHQNVNSRYI